MTRETNTYDQFAEQYVTVLGRHDEADISQDPIASRLLEITGDVEGLSVLDAGCGEGYLSRELASHGAKVIGMDISPRLVEMARAKDLEGTINYQVEDLSKSLPQYENHFDLVASNMVLNDIYDYQGFASTLNAVTKDLSRLVLSMNNPYSFVIRKQVGDYFDSGYSALYRGMAAEGLKVSFFHRTLEDYITAFRNNGFLLDNFADIPHTISSDNALVPMGSQFPYFSILSFIKCGESKQP
ncbi:MAG: methyltransferase domain-containing protein [Gemmatimonadetes bacterium]|jgi:2-polyprenyl-3-methyl-5-hydroxy-6-metoxy-1,4-benzoquinol methylase|nr:methyltransferase domain-containing protein [Gemmatimonadota bacterium]MBT7912405.1 methyltransferase domain-containing protein [Candidatus Bathyarchaeota archaeon]